jgi:hypothetical protein
MWRPNSESALGFRARARATSTSLPAKRPYRAQAKASIFIGMCGTVASEIVEA